ncbi:rhodanese-like domain-containing protein [Aquabacterium sp. OR-4]|uniref:rhodanese-like domain-containing protein n=1 Tax=Aquabacterium sp. OR-4 TaxID=2978127 RepID=UPI0021B23822|nr:rhodanese-like domain-containing protein [Aquabacterium sp. OR-4]MDT7834810.1 rhodanese-like domain-containing protein [Aquabacterium sp. OR-4]
MTAPLRQIRVQDLASFIAQHAAQPGSAPPLLLDVREAWELETARLELPGTRLLHLPMGELPQRLDELDPAQTILALCHHGMRSLQCVAYLQRQGHAHVYNVHGGIDAWSTQVDASVPRY